MLPSVAVAVMIVVPTPLIVTFPLVLLTAAIPVLLDLNVTVPSVVFVSAFVKAASVVFLVTLLFVNLSTGVALLMVN